MRYITDILERYKSGFGFVHGAARANLEGLLNVGIFKAGIAANNAYYTNKSSNNQDFKLEKYTESIRFADIEFQYNGESIKLGMCSLLDGATQESTIIAPPPVVSFKREKNINVTVIDDGDEAEIVENFGLNSWDIEINGVLIDMAEHAYPKEAMQHLCKFFEINDVIDVICPLFQDLGIRSVWFREQSIEPLEAFPDTIKYLLQAKSIKPAEFTEI
jgi:hypothetical protein